MTIDHDLGETKNGLKMLFLITNSLKVGIYFEYKGILQYYGPSLLMSNLFSSRYTTYWFYIFTFLRDVLKF